MSVMEKMDNGVMHLVNRRKKLPAETPLEGAPLTVWQLIKSCFTGVLCFTAQTLLQLFLPFIFDRFTTALPNWMRFLFNVDQLFDASTAEGAAQAAKYVVDGTVTWGYMLPFFLSNIIVNIFGYFWNRKFTFKSNAPRSHFVIYFVIMVATIVVMTWFQGFLFPIFSAWGLGSSLTRFLVLLPASMIQFVVFFISQKLLLPPIPEDE